jgi:hypothetical protein
MCGNDADCSKFDGPQGTFLCANHHCVTPLAYRGASCNDDRDCIRDEGSRCVRQQPIDAQGVCLHPCGDNGSCLPRGGINHTCVPLLGKGEELLVCFPGNFGFPCVGDENCTGDLKCHDAKLDAQPDPILGLCTIFCADDTDCANDRWAAGSWCGVSPTEGTVRNCYPPQLKGSCDRDRMCATGVCNLTEHKCLEVPAP